MTFRLLLTLTVVAHLSGPGAAGTQDSSVVWGVESFQGDSTVLLREFDRSIFPVQFLCDGTPPVFRISFLPPKESAKARSGSTAVLDGTLRIPPAPIREVEWTGRVWLTTPLDRNEVESLVESAGALEIEIQTPDGETIRHHSPESTGIAPAVMRFLESCDHHVKETDRHFEVDGIQVDLRVEVDENGIEDIRALAAELGIRDVQKIYVGFYGLPMPMLMALVDSRPVRDGDRIGQSQLTLVQKYWRPWESNRADSEDKLTRGLWRAGTRDLDSIDRWIVRDGDWSIEARLGAGVPYDDAVRIFRAIRADALVDVRERPPVPLSVRPYDLKQWSATTLPRIERDADAVAGESGRYAVDIPSSMGSGTILQVRVVDDRVEVLSVSWWIA